ncbi:MAG: hypothetical protein CFE24_02335 [Flavobacterium sp. BFFFF2]|nr:MAG: hypothetical protein CFE24_02335 [Flavobacterium sp. BFFFF2]
MGATRPGGSGCRASLFWPKAQKELRQARHPWRGNGTLKGKGVFYVFRRDFIFEMDIEYTILFRVTRCFSTFYILINSMSQDSNANFPQN